MKDSDIHGNHSISLSLASLQYFSFSFFLFFFHYVPVCEAHPVLLVLGVSVYQEPPRWQHTPQENSLWNIYLTKKSSSRLKVHGSGLKILLFNTNTRGPKGEKDGGRERGEGEVVERREAWREGGKDSQWYKDEEQLHAKG